MQTHNLKNKILKVKKHSSHVFSKLLSFKASKLDSGFSLIELIIVVSIMIVVTSAVLFRQSKFSSDILITNMAYEVALSIREAAVNGLSSKTSSSLDRVGYGVNFSPDPDSGGSPGSFINFVDNSGVSIDASLDDNDIFDYFYTPTVDSVDKEIDLTQGQLIEKYCARTNIGSEWVCGPADGRELNIVYVKPNPEAHITMGTKEGKNDESYSEARIVVQSGLGDKCRTVEVSSSGQISVMPVSSDDPDPSGCDGGI